MYDWSMANLEVLEAHWLDPDYGVSNEVIGECSCCGECIYGYEDYEEYENRIYCEKCMPTIYEDNEWGEEE